MPLELDRFEHQIFFATLRIEAKDSASDRRSIGTGFLVGYIHPEQPSRGIMTLVSCRHVFFGPSGIITARLHRSQSSVNDLPLLGSQILLGPLAQAIPTANTQTQVLMLQRLTSLSHSKLGKTSSVDGSSPSTS
jgi:hypothetical protein